MFRGPGSAFMPVSKSVVYLMYCSVFRIGGIFGKRAISARSRNYNNCMVRSLDRDPLVSPDMPLSHAGVQSMLGGLSVGREVLLNASE